MVINSHLHLTIYKPNILHCDQRVRSLDYRIKPYNIHHVYKTHFNIDKWNAVQTI